MGRYAENATPCPSSGGRKPNRKMAFFHCIASMMTSQVLCGFLKVGCVGECVASFIMLSVNSPYHSFFLEGFKKPF